MDESKYWDEKLRVYTKEKWSRQPAEFGCFAVSYFSNKGKVLDLGAGPGLDAVYFSQKGYEVVATDISNFAKKEIMARAREVQINVKFKKADLREKLPFKNKSFDVVYAHQSLHFFNDRTTKRIVREVHRILKPDGMFTALFNSTKDPEIKELRKISKDYYCSTRGLTKRFFSVGYMRQIVKGYFKIILLDSKGKTSEDNYRSMIRFVGKKIARIAKYEKSESILLKRKESRHEQHH